MRTAWLILRLLSIATVFVCLSIRTYHVHHHVTRLLQVQWKLLEVPVCQVSLVLYYIDGKKVVGSDDISALANFGS